MDAKWSTMVDEVRQSTTIAESSAKGFAIQHQQIADLNTKINALQMDRAATGLSVSGADFQAVADAVNALHETSMLLATAIPVNTTDPAPQPLPETTPAVDDPNALSASTAPAVLDPGVPLSKNPGMPPDVAALPPSYPPPPLVPPSTPDFVPAGQPTEVVFPAVSQSPLAAV